MKKITLLIICLFVQNFYTTAQVYDYPIKPGTEAWRRLNTSEEMLKVCQLPENILNTINTKDLVLTCVNYPLFSWIYTTNKLERGLENTFQTFNGFNELFKRPDAAVNILEIYTSLKTNKVIEIDEKNLVARGSYSFQLSYLEFLLANNLIIDNTDTLSRKMILTELLLKYDEKIMLSEVFSRLAIQSTIYALAKISTTEGISLSGTEFKENDLSVLMNSLNISDKKIVDEWVALLRKYLKK